MKEIRKQKKKRRKQNKNRKRASGNPSAQIRKGARGPPGEHRTVTPSLLLLHE
jgi:hypothetical protein